VHRIHILDSCRTCIVPDPEISDPAGSRSVQDQTFIVESKSNVKLVIYYWIAVISVVSTVLWMQSCREAVLTLVDLSTKYLNWIRLCWIENLGTGQIQELHWSSRIQIWIQCITNKLQRRVIIIYDLNKFVCWILSNPIAVDNV